MGPRMHDAIDSHVDVWVKELPWLDPVKEEVLSRIDRIAGHVNAGRAETFAANESALWQYKTLLTLRKQGPPYELSPSRLAEQLGLTRGAISSRLALLEDRGHVVRHHDHLDRRRVTVALTPAGHRHVETMLEREEQRELAVLAPLTDAEKNQLAELLRKIVVDL